jgi:hypothetical protein
MDILIFSFFTAIVLFAFAAVQYGADSREAILDPRHPSSTGLS